MASVETALGRAHGLRTFGLALTQDDDRAHLADARQKARQKAPSPGARGRLGRAESKAETKTKTAHDDVHDKRHDKRHDDTHDATAATAATISRIAAKQHANPADVAKRKPLPTPQQAWTAHFGRAGGANPHLPSVGT